MLATHTTLKPSCLHSNIIKRVGKTNLWPKAGIHNTYIDNDCAKKSKKKKNSHKKNKKKNKKTCDIIFGS